MTQYRSQRQNSGRTPTQDYRGSRRHVLEWTSQDSFINELVSLVRPVAVEIGPSDSWMPRGAVQPREARLGSFGPKALPQHPVWGAFRQWWVRDQRGNTPNWDI